MKNIVDFHSHILPGMDDGSASVAESIALLRMEAEQGIDHVVATPHFYPQKDTPERFLQRRAEAEAALREEMQKHTGLPKLSVGAEVFYFPGISDSEAMASLTVDRKRCILIEMPQPPWSDAVYREIQGLYTKRGLIPIIAHIDRYIGAFRTYGIPDRLAEYPVLVQANAEFFLGRTTSSLAMRLLKRNRIHLLGSDCHRIASRSPNLGQALERIGKKLGEGPFDEIRACQKYVLRDA